MRLKKFVLLALTLFAFSANADQNKYDEILSQIDFRYTTISDLSGLYNGNCYRKHDPKTPLPVVFNFIQMQEDSIYARSMDNISGKKMFWIEKGAWALKFRMSGERETRVGPFILTQKNDWKNTVLATSKGNNKIFTDGVYTFELSREIVYSSPSIGRSGKLVDKGIDETMFMEAGHKEEFVDPSLRNSWKWGQKIFFKITLEQDYISRDELYLCELSPF